MWRDATALFEKGGKWLTVNARKITIELSMYERCYVKYEKRNRHQDSAKWGDTSCQGRR